MKPNLILIISLLFVSLLFFISELFSLKKEYIFSITIPAKVQTYLACAKPVVAMVDGEPAKMIDDAKAGLSCPSESPELLVKNIKLLSSLNDNKLDKLGQNALNYYNNEFERTMLMDKIENIFNKMTNEKYNNLPIK